MFSQSLACFQFSSPHRTSLVWCYHQTNLAMSSGDTIGKGLNNRTQCSNDNLTWQFVVLQNSTHYDKSFSKLALQGLVWSAARSLFCIYLYITQYVSQ